jgi:asparagine synthase (glutamine-hydrolysing)
MCGIAAYFGEQNPSATEQLRDMLREQEHRGPDGVGLCAWTRGCKPSVVYGATWNELPRPEVGPVQCALGHNWLAIQDRSDAARQPMLLGNFGLAYNGEIYNFIELRDELRAQQATFRTSSDSEVLLELWRRLGPAALPRLRGMFAFVLYDAEREELWAVRDPFGIKPLYYALTPQGVYFSSEIRSLHAGIVKRALRGSAVIASAAAGINKFGHLETLYEDIYELPAGHWLKWTATGSQLRPYYQLPTLTGDLRGEDGISELRDALQESVRLHLRASRRIASCLSGGLDSTNLAWLIGQNRDLAGDEFVAYTICTAQQQDSEVDLATEVTKRAGVKHRIYDSPGAIPASDALEMAVAYEVPNHVIGPINQFLLLRIISGDGAVVVLDGQGGDELVSGYSWYWPVLLKELRNRYEDVRPWIEARSSRLPLSPELTSLFDSMFHDADAWVQAFTEGDFLGVPAHVVRELPEVEYYLAGGGDWCGFREREYYRAELAYLLRQEDRIGMWFGLECRVPYVDRKLVEVAARLAPELLIKDGYLKYPLRQILPDAPQSVRWNTRKRGFWETDMARFPWLAETAKTLAFDSPKLRHLFPALEQRFGTLNTDQLWRLTQIALLERCANRRQVRDLCATELRNVGTSPHG